MVTRRGASAQAQPQPTVLNRLTVYVTYVPHSRRTSELQLVQRTDAYKAGATTSHWPDKVEVKTYPWGFGPAYEAKGFGQLVPRLDENGAIPAERLRFI